MKKIEVCRRGRFHGERQSLRGVVSDFLVTICEVVAKTSESDPEMSVVAGNAMEGCKELIDLINRRKHDAAKQIL